MGSVLLLWEHEKHRCVHACLCVCMGGSEGHLPILYMTGPWESNREERKEVSQGDTSSETTWVA